MKEWFTEVWEGLRESTGVLKVLGTSIRVRVEMVFLEPHWKLQLRTKVHNRSCSCGRMQWLAWLQQIGKECELQIPRVDTGARASRPGLKESENQDASWHWKGKLEFSGQTSSEGSQGRDASKGRQCGRRGPLWTLRWYRQWSSEQGFMFRWCWVWEHRLCSNPSCLITRCVNSAPFSFLTWKSVDSSLIMSLNS